MNNRSVNNRRARRGARRSRPQTGAQSLQALKSIVQMQEVQVRGTEPQVPDVPRLILKRNKVYTVSQATQLSVITTSTTVDTAIGYSFNLGNFPDYTSYTSVFDAYRLVQIVVEFIPRQSSINDPPLYSILDYDDSATPSALSVLQQYDTLKMTQAGQIHTRVLNPRIAIAAYSVSFSSFAQANSMVWIDSANVNVQYYGVKIYIQAGANVTTYDVTVRSTMQFRNSR